MKFFVRSAVLSRIRSSLNLKRLILFLAISATIVTFLNSFYSSYHVQKQQLKVQALKNNSAYAAKLVSVADSALRLAQQQLAFSADVIAENFADPHKVAHEAKRLRLQTNSFNSTVVVDKDAFILTASPASLQITGEQLNSVGAKQALEYKKPIISEPYISIANNLVIFISHPLFTEDNQYLGYVGGTMYLKEPSILSDILQQHFHQDGSYLYVIDKNQRLLYHPDKQRIGEQVFGNAVIEAVLKGNRGTQEIVTDDNVILLAGYAPLQVAPWGIVTERSLTSTLAPLDGLMIKVLLYTAPIGLATVIFIWVLARLIARPLQQLADTAKTLELPSTPADLKRVRSWYFESSALRLAMLKGVGVLQNQIGLLKHEAQTDPLTELNNRRSLEIHLKQLTEHHCKFSVLAIDIDHFKHVNDQFGHDIGDTVLQSLAAIIMSVIRESDFAARTGGEEFIIISPNVIASQAFQLAERLRIKVANTVIEPVGYINISIGIAGWPMAELTVEDVLKRADQALYEAKKTGRNRCVLEQTYGEAATH
ncbi:sensor domain-containing diguanylate cyclase [Pseudoalteromonas mariniglutinosa]|uniref:sensor domain-containing diguanylate cyclase n=1 Tax=Pseudoalteromonas mariniglutinosa TaxID=206042 RepID=UPI00384BD361